MTREELSKLVNFNRHRYYLLQLATSMGKTKVALDTIAKKYKPGEAKILILVPYITIKNNWINEEIPKWKYTDYLPDITISTYAGINKVVGKYDICICDEVHHLTPRCREYFKAITFKYFIGLSATVKQELKDWLTYKFKGIEIIKASLVDAIQSNILAEPTIYLLPIKLNNTFTNCLYECNKSSKTNPIVVTYKDRWNYKKGYKGRYYIKCTQQQYYNEISGLIEWYKQKSSNARMKNMWLHTAGERLKWLASQKLNIIRELNRKVNKHRALIFCATIEQSEQLNIPCVNSKIGLDNLDKFNSKKINSIAAIAMLDEGVSLVDCRICIFQMINSSQRQLCQRVGRGMRHASPIMIFPYFKDTREEEIINKEIIENYPESSIKVIHSIDEIKL